MRKALLAIIVVTTALCSQPSAAQVHKGSGKGRNAGKNSDGFIDNARYLLSYSS